MTPKNIESSYGAILKDAARIAERSGLQSYNTFHLLLAILRRDSFLREWFAEKQINFNDLLVFNPPGNGAESFLGELLSRVRKIANTAQKPRKPMHMLYAILSFGQNGLGFQALSTFMDPALLLQEIVQKRWLKNLPNETEEKEEKEVEKRGLEKYGIDYTELAREGKLYNVVGRDKEIEAIVRILAQKDLDASYDEAINNPVLIGDAGTGKTALAKALALLIAQKDPKVQFLWNHRLVYLKLGMLTAGTGVRGTLEAKLEEILQDCKSEPTITFFDELHVIMGLGKTEGSPGIEEVLKPILAEGLSCIGATTTEEWRRDIESKNSAFAQRWIPVVVEQPDEDKTLQILRSAVHNIARRHLVHFPSEVLVTAVKMGRRYMPYDSSPRREIDKILNGVGALVKLEGRSLANVEDVVGVISQISGMPICTERVQQERIVNALTILSSKIFGQEEANEALATAMQRYFSGMRDPNKPLVVLALGPTGVGKTFSAKIVAKEFMFDRMTRFDMSEYQEKHTTSRLIGSPPGYIGYENPGQLTEGLRRMGMGVVLMDEMEKAHPDVCQALLGLYDEGRMTDGQGKTADGKDCIFFMTSNIGSRLFAPTQTSAKIGFGGETKRNDSFEDVRRKVLQEARQCFSPELWNRIDLVLVYRPHNDETVRKIATALLKEEKEKCQLLGFTINWKPEVVEYLAVRGYSPLNGARPMKRVIMNDIQTLFAQPLLNRELQNGDNVMLTIENNVVVWRKV